ncbi:ABC transporter substrate-binding protein [Oscillospiraceae bacterium MB08-C2-2]|nr:ABC transporter substrate-binding protein [Oscillospiraceae bacterium MB08-C2-2]
MFCGKKAPAEESPSEGKIVIEDQLGRTIEFDQAPTRTATTIMPFPSIYFTVAGSAERLVGMNPSSLVAYNNSTLKYLSPEMAQVSTDFVDTSFIVNVEEALKLKPDVVFQWTYMPEEIEKMEAAGLKVIALKYGSLEDLQTWIRIIGKLVEREERAEEIITLFNENIAETDAIMEKLPKEDYVSMIQLTADLTVAGTGFSNFWIDKSGSVNPGKDLEGDDRKIDMEQVLQWNPQVIYIGNFTDIMPADLLENKLAGQDWSLVDAVKNKRVYKIPIGSYRWDPPCVETPLMVKWMAQKNHPELLADMDMKQEVRDFYKEIYEFDITDAMIDEILGNQ